MKPSTPLPAAAHALGVLSYQSTSGPSPPRADPRVGSPQSIARRQASRGEATVDAMLVGRFNGGDETAFVEIVARYREKIQALAGRCLRNRADAEEIAQDTFIRAHRGLSRFRGESSLATWLHRIAFNLARNRYWYHFRRHRHLTVSFDCPLGTDTTATFRDRVAAGEPNPARQAAMNEFVVIAADCMAKLDADHREILTMRNSLHWPYGEMRPLWASTPAP